MKKDNKKSEKYPINDMFTYGISGNCIHLHLPTDLHEVIAENGISKAMSLANLYLLDAIDKIKALKDSDFYRFKDKDSIYMISPTMIKTEMKFLEELKFTTHSYSKKQLRDEEFVRVNPEAQLAIHMFGKDKKIGTASIGFDIINSEEWQEKKNGIVEQLKNKGMVIEDGINMVK